MGPTTSWGAARRPKKAPDSVTLRDARRQLGKTFYMAHRVGKWWQTRPAVSANTHCRFRHHGNGSPYLLYVK